MSGISLSIGGDGWEETMWAEIWDMARKKGKIMDPHLGVYEFSYALINPKDGYGRQKVSTKGEPYMFAGSDVTFWIKDTEGENPGFNIAGLPFVFERRLPRTEFGDYVGLHEHTETIAHTLIDAEWHGEGCRIELAEVFKRGTEFIDAYASWLVSMARSCTDPKESYFERAIPEFRSTLIMKDISPAQILSEFKRRLDDGGHIGKV